MIRLENLTVALDGFTLRDIELNITEGEYFILVGPTGAGKTVLLESIAGHHPVAGGRVWVRGRDITGLEPEKRRVSIVYQDYSLFPHLSARDNIVFGLRLHQKSQRETGEALEWIASLLSISHLLPRKPETLSGGERQKVALARALAVRPDVLLLDEPLAALDPEAREKVRTELRQLHRSFGTTTIHVTHDFEEAMSLGDRLAVLGEGELKQIGTPEQVFRRPNSEFVARFTMARNILAGEASPANGGSVFRSGGRDIVVQTTNLRGDCYAAVRPEDIMISPEPAYSDTPNCFAGRVTGITDKGGVLSITVDLPPEFWCLVMRHSFEQMELKLGQPVYLSFSPASVHLFPK
jgi:ABC-type Fe3+/spermidine/putrescine transport system ATPase subunit